MVILYVTKYVVELLAISPDYLQIVTHNLKKKFLLFTKIP